MEVLHVAVEGGPAVFGGLGRVATQMVSAQNRFVIDGYRQFDASIITPLYPALHASYQNLELVAEVEHAYDHNLITSKIYFVEIGLHKHYLIEPPPEYQHLFALNSLPEIYCDTDNSLFIQRVKFLNSCVAAYIGNGRIGIKHPDPKIVQLHDWQGALLPELLTKIYNNNAIKTVFTVHIDNGDRGAYSCEDLDGIGLNFNKKVCILKAIGLVSANKIVAVSPKFLKECIETRSDDKELELLRKIFAWSSVQNKTIGIANGINYDEYCPLGKHIDNLQAIHDQKSKVKQQIAAQIAGSRLVWKFDPNLPLILYVGRYSPEKGAETFDQVIKDTAGRATFLAVGRGMTDDVFRVMVKHSRQTDNVFVTASEIEQAQLISMLRAAADIVLVPSHRDAFGLVAPEGIANGSIIITTGVGGIRDAVTQLNFTDPNNTTGNGIFYEDQPEGGYNHSLASALRQALDLYSALSPQQISAMQARIMLEGRRFDWAAPNGSLAQYLQVYNQLLMDKTSDLAVAPRKASNHT